MPGRPTLSLPGPEFCPGQTTRPFPNVFFSIRPEDRISSLLSTRTSSLFWQYTVQRNQPRYRTGVTTTRAKISLKTLCSLDKYFCRMQTASCHTAKNTSFKTCITKTDVLKNSFEFMWTLFSASLRRVDPAKHKL